jgi:hypothetical protein
MGVAMARVAITGTRPLLFHHFTEQVFAPVDPNSRKGQRRTGRAGNDPQEWKRTVLLTQDRQLYLEPTYIYGTLRHAAKFTPAGGRRGSMMAAVAATVQVLEDRILLDRCVPPDEYVTRDPTQPIYVDVRMVRNPATRGSNLRYRLACAPPWHAAFTLLWEDTVVSPELLHAIAIDAGRLVGVGDARSIGLGRFDVDAFVLEPEAAHA